MIYSQRWLIKVKELLMKIGFTNKQASVLTILIGDASYENVEYLLRKVEEEEIDKKFEEILKEE